MIVRRKDKLSKTFDNFEDVLEDFDFYMRSQSQLYLTYFGFRRIAKSEIPYLRQIYKAESQLYLTHFYCKCRE